MIPDQRRYEDLHQLLVLSAAAFPADATVFVLTVMVGEPGPSASSCCSACGTGTLKSPCSGRGMLLPYPVCSIRPAGCSLPTWCQLQGWQKTRWKEDQKIFISIPSSWPSIGAPGRSPLPTSSPMGSAPQRVPSQETSSHHVHGPAYGNQERSPKQRHNFMQT